MVVHALRQAERERACLAQIARLDHRWVTVTGVDGERVTVGADGLSMPMPWSGFTLGERRAIAAELARAGHEQACAAAVVLAWLDRDADAAAGWIARLADRDLQAAIDRVWLVETQGAGD